MIMFVPRPRRKLVTYLPKPSTIETTVMIDVTAMMIPSTVSSERALFAQIWMSAVAMLPTDDATRSGMKTRMFSSVRPRLMTPPPAPWG